MSSMNECNPEIAEPPSQGGLIKGRSIVSFAEAYDLHRHDKTHQHSELTIGTWRSGSIGRTGFFPYSDNIVEVLL